MRVFLLVLFISLGYVSVAQVQTGVTPTGKHARWIEGVKQLFKKKEKTEVKARKAKEKKDQLQEDLAQLDTAGLDSASFRLGGISYDGVAYDSAGVPLNANINEKAAEERLSSAMNNQLPAGTSSELQELNELGQPTAPNANMPGLPGDQSALNQSVPGQESVPGAGGVGGESASSLLLAMNKPNVNPGAMTVGKATLLMNNIGMEKFQAARQALDPLKEVYSVVPSIDKAKDDGIKKQSLEGQPLYKRFYLGGNFSLPSTDPLKIDADIQAGFRVNRKVETGVTFSWRETFVKKDSIITGPDNVSGYGLFVKYLFPKGFFLYTEGGRLRDLGFFESSETDVRWQYRYLIGGGKELQISSYVRLTISVLYDLNYRNNDLSPLPFVWRIGYKIGAQ